MLLALLRLARARNSEYRSSDGLAICPPLHSFRRYVTLLSPVQLGFMTTPLPSRSSRSQFDPITMHTCEALETPQVEASVQWEACDRCSDDLPLASYVWPISVRPRVPMRRSVF